MLLGASQWRGHGPCGRETRVDCGDSPEVAMGLGIYGTVRRGSQREALDPDMRREGAAELRMEKEVH